MIYTSGTTSGRLSFLHSIASLLRLCIEIPDYSTLCRRSRLLRKKLRIGKAASNQPIHLMIDSTGLRIHVGTTRKPPKQRAWRKLHIAVDRKTGNIVASELTASRARDATRVPPLLTQIQAPIASVAADSAYDKEAVYEAIEAHSPGRRTRVVIPPQRNATLSQNSNTAMRERDRHIRAIERHGRREWYKLSGCTERSMVENAVYRYKAIMGPEMRTRTLARQPGPFQSPSLNRPVDRQAYRSCRPSSSRLPPRQTRPAKGFNLPFDVVRRFAQPMGIDLDAWTGRIIGQEKGVVRLLPVAERAGDLFGEDGAGAVADWIESDPDASLQATLFPELDSAPTTRNLRRGRKRLLDSDAELQTINATVLDRVHAAMLLQASGHANALRTLVRAEQDRGPEFLRLANALSALYPRGCQEKRLLDAMLLAVPR